MAVKNMANNGSGRVAKARMPLGRRHTDTAKDARGGWILQTVQALAQTATKQNVPGCSVLNKEIERVKFTNDMIIKGEFRNGKEITSNRGYPQNIAKVELPRRMTS